MGRKSIDLTGQTFGQLLVVGPVETSGKKPKVKCICSCHLATELVVDKSDLVAGKKTSCGCGRDRLSEERYHFFRSRMFGLLHPLAWMTRDKLPPSARARAHWLCTCRCGRFVRASCWELESSTKRSCEKPACKEQAKAERLKEFADTTDEELDAKRRFESTRDIFHEARRRCKSHPDYFGKWYEGWQTFEDFLQDVPVRPDFISSLDRIDPHGRYEPGNVRWADKQTQARNKKRDTRIQIAPGRKVYRADLALVLDITVTQLTRRYERLREQGFTDGQAGESIYAEFFLKEAEKKIAQCALATAPVELPVAA